MLACDTLTIREANTSLAVTFTSPMENNNKRGKGGTRLTPFTVRDPQRCKDLTSNVPPINDTCQVNNYLHRFCVILTNLQILLLTLSHKHVTGLFHSSHFDLS